jgi:hypothetical protein
MAARCRWGKDTSRRERIETRLPTAVSHTRERSTMPARMSRTRSNSIRFAVGRKKGSSST